MNAHSRSHTASERDERQLARWSQSYRDLMGRLGPPMQYRRVATVATLRRRSVVERARSQAVGLSSSEHEGGRRLAELLRRVASDHLAAPEEAQLRVVEQERARILHSDASVPWSGGRESLARICARASQPAAGARILYHAVAVWRPQVALELGTCVGLSAAYQASAQALNGGGRFISLEAYPDLAEEARRVWAACRLDHASVVVGSFSDSLGPLLTQVSPNYAYVDGHHDGDATRAYVDLIAEHAERGALIVLDDIDYSSGMRGAWQDVQHRPYVVASADLGKIGLVVLT